MTIQDLIVFAGFIVFAAFMIHRSGAGAGPLRTAAGWVVGLVMAVLAAASDVVQRIIGG